MVASVGEEKDINALFVGIREFQTEKVYLLSRKKRMETAKQAKKDLERFQVPAVIIEISDLNFWEETFRNVAEIKNLENERDIIINIATGDRGGRCATTSAAFVNGLKAFDVDENNEPMLLPILKFSYYKQLTDRKMDILKVLNNKDCCSSLEMLSKKTGMSLPLVSYHINGNLKSEGLKELGLVETVEVKGKIDVRLTTMGKMLIKGYI